MPTLDEVRDAALTVAKVRGSREYFATPAKFYGELIPLIVRRPQDWGFDPMWAINRRPNWDMETLGPMVADAIWGMPFHPACEAARRWRRLPFKVLKRLAGGVTPQNVVGGGVLSARESTELLDSAAANRRSGEGDWAMWLESPLAWITRHCPIGGYVPRSRLIADWLVAKKLWHGWTAPIEIGYQADGQMGTVRPADMLDEVQDADLAQGAKSNPAAVFRAILARTSQSALVEIAKRNLPFPVMPWTEMPGVRQIKTSAELVAEGGRMCHCVGGYSERCIRGSCFILALPNSTAEVLPDGEIYQHRGYKNAVPSVTDKQILASWRAKRKARKL